MDTVSRETGLDPWFVTGLAEGAAQFTFSRSGEQVSLYFALKMDGEDRALLHGLQDFFGGAGRIYETQPGKLYFRITRGAELSRVVDHFDLYPLQGSRRATYGAWRELLQHKLEAKRRPDPATVRTLAARISSGVHPKVDAPSRPSSPRTRFEPEFD